ncbi:NADPH-dependent FMN reductase [Streptomyces sp. NBC_00083]|uniref:NADPH-dependent FMN reductase n=1 Tax=Streptomyces sp. NBC_00083 TaxID=2975647 RepID=UPI00225B5124|nr:NADPH-dependent FMN reductase [Streptomyces sp. NBC_00083]MCX5382503.1 NADPH-dependent FMN reductase [Streptomyces sp. NBC_00083]
MPTILAVSGSPSPVSSTHQVLTLAAERLAARGHRVESLAVRTLPAAELLRADLSNPRLADAAALFAAADAVVLATPVYKAGCSGLLKSFLDVLPQFGLAGKVVLPLATGGSLAHVLALDYGLRPVLMSMKPRAISESFFVHAGGIRKGPCGFAGLEPETEALLHEATDTFADLVESLTESTADGVTGATAPAVRLVSAA